jgi:hypothetical protein
MSLYEYNYTKEVAADRLTLEIQESTITIALDHITVDGTSVAIFFKDDLGTQETALNTIVADHVATHLPDNQPQNVKIQEVEADLTNNVPIQDRDLADRAGKNVYKHSESYFVDSNESDNIYLVSFNSYMYLCGGGYQVLPKIYIDGQEFIQKPEHGDTVTFDLVDIDNITGLSKTASIHSVERSSNVVTITTVADHSFVVGDMVHVDASDDTFDEMEVEVQSVPSSTMFTYNQTASDVVSKSDTGDVGLCKVLGIFVPGDYIGPGSEWELVTPDGKLVPPGVYMRARITSTGNNDYYVYSWYNMRTYSA